MTLSQCVRHTHDLSFSLWNDPRYKNIFREDDKEPVIGNNRWYQNKYYRRVEEAHRNRDNNSFSGYSCESIQKMIVKSRSKLLSNYQHLRLTEPSYTLTVAVWDLFSHIITLGWAGTYAMKNYPDNEDFLGFLNREVTVVKVFFDKNMKMKAQALPNMHDIKAEHLPATDAYKLLYDLAGMARYEACRLDHWYFWNGRKKALALFEAAHKIEECADQIDNLDHEEKIWNGGIIQESKHLQFSKITETNKNLQFSEVISKSGLIPAISMHRYGMFFHDNKPTKTQENLHQIFPTAGFYPKIEI